MQFESFDWLSHHGTVYEPLYHMAKPEVTCTSSFCCFFILKNKVSTLIDLYRCFVAFFNKTIIPLTLVGYEMIVANLVLRA